MTIARYVQHDVLATFARGHVNLPADRVREYRAQGNRMRAKLMDMMTTNRHLPVPFPPTVSAPKHRLVKKVSNEGC